MGRAGDGARLVLAVATLAALQGCGDSQPLVQSRIRHVVIVFQENRTPDNLFHGLPNADIATEGVNSQGETIELQPTHLVSEYDLQHLHPSFVAMYDDGRMDGADKIKVTCKEDASPDCPPPNPHFRYVDPAELAPYFALATRYTFGDRMFQTNQGPSFPAHQYIIAATSQPTAESPLFASENPIDLTTGQHNQAGCAAPETSEVALIDASGDESQRQYPCFEHLTLMDLLDERLISWRYYTPSEPSIWTGPNAIAHLRNGPGWSNVIMPETQVLTDIATGALPQVSWVMPSGQASDHAHRNDGSGPDWVATIVNAIGNSPYWEDTAVLIAWDDWGGWYDHVAPPSIQNQYEYGFRVPLIVVSPYARPGYVSHVTHDFGSILKLVEVAFDLPSLGFADLRADDLSDCFDFQQAPLPFETVATERDAEYFLRQQMPPAAPRSDPDDE